MSDLKYSYTSTTQQQAPGSYLTGTNPTVQPYTSTTDYGIASSPAYTSNFQHYGISNASPLVSYNYTQEIKANVETPVRSAGSYTSGVGAPGLSNSELGGNTSGLGLGYLYGSQAGTPTPNYGVAQVTGTLSSSQIGASGTGYHHVSGGLSGSQVGAGSYLAGTSNYTPGVTGLSASQTLANTQPGNYTTTTTTYNVGGTTTAGGNYGTTYSSGVHGTSATGNMKSSGLDSDSAVNVFLGDLRTSVIREVKKNMEYRGPTFGKELRNYIETNVQSKPLENRKTAVADALVHYNLVSSDRINNPSRLWQDAPGNTTSLPGSYTATQPTYTVRDPSVYGSTHNLGTTVNVESYQTPQRTSYGYETTIGEHQKRSAQSVPSHLYSQSRASYLDPYRQSSYPEFAVVEDLPDRTHLVDSINIFLKRSPAKEKLLVSPSRVSIKRESILHPAEIEVTSLFKEKYEDGSVYEGESRNGKRHGKGKIIYRDGRVFEGEFENGVAQGTGKITYSSGKLCYEGGISGTAFEGQGVLQTEIPATFYGDFNYKDFRNLGKQWLRYEGEFKSGNKHGTGSLYLSNGEKYTGEFRDDEVHGKGIFTLRDGRSVKGEWKHGVLQTY